MKSALATILGWVILALLFLAWIGWVVITDSGSMVSRDRLNKTQSELDHERTMNWLLSRRLAEQSKGNP